MVRITEDLVRKRAEHNECEISTLEEVSLHQQDIERIEYLDKWCRELKILYLQSNLIPKIENVSRLKKLEYLNLALNNVERVENLEAWQNAASGNSAEDYFRTQEVEGTGSGGDVKNDDIRGGCESLQKLDLTVNFVGELTSIENLKHLEHFQELFLTGNPCVEYEGYRTYVIATLPHLMHLDGTEIERSERIKALQEFDQVYPRILQQQAEYKRKREKQKLEEEEKEKKEQMRSESKPGFDGRWYTDINESDKKDMSQGDASDNKENKSDRDKEKEFWDEKVAYTPESRIKVHKHLEEARKKEENSKEDTPKKQRTLITEDGRILNVNEAQVDFSLIDDEDKNEYVLDIAVFRHMDTSLLDIDVQPSYIRVYLKGKVLQLKFDEEVNVDSSSAQRSSTTGHLVVTLPKVKSCIKPSASKPPMQNKPQKNTPSQSQEKQGSSHEKLEVDPSKSQGPDFGNIVKEKSPVPPLGGALRTHKKEERANSEDFVDDPDVPPLE